MSSRVSRLRYRLNPSAMVSSSLGRSLDALNETAARPPERILRPPDTTNPPLVLYIFRVPGRLDLCLSTSRPGADIVTDIDVAASLYYVRIVHEGDRINMTLVRRNPATDSNKEIALMLDPPGHIDVYERDYQKIESRYWAMNGQDRFSVCSTFGAYIRQSDDKTSISTPWVGVCHFSSIKLGNAIKGIHALRHFEGGPSANDVQVSELRFNFMASASSSVARKLAKRASVPLPLVLPSEAGPSDDKKIKRRSFFSKSADMTPVLSSESVRRVSEEAIIMNASGEVVEQAPALPPRIPRKPVSSSSFTPDTGLDLSLGKEKLGGGFDGEQAKLGKLIIETEGEKMLDLLIAANVLLFRRAFAAVSL